MSMQDAIDSQPPYVPEEQPKPTHPLDALKAYQSILLTQGHNTYSDGERAGVANALRMAEQALAVVERDRDEILAQSRRVCDALDKEIDRRVALQELLEADRATIEKLAEAAESMACRARGQIAGRRENKR